MAGKKARAKERKGADAPKLDKSVLSQKFDSFELKSAPGKGIGAFATRSMAAGTSFFRENPVMVFDKPVIFISEREVIMKYNALSTANKALFNQARHERGHPSNCKCKKGVIVANDFSNPGEPANTYPIGSRFNHSCDPNVMMLTPLKGKYQTFRTLKAVEEGEELCFSYSSKFDFLTQKQRQAELNDDSWRFKCMCSFCHQPVDKSLVSDMRRVLLRHLVFWLRKRDVPEAEPSPALLRTVPDPKLVRNGVYSLLYAMLHEAEGIVTGADAYTAYALTAWHVLNFAFHNNIERIPPSTVQDMRMWMARSEANVRLQFGDDLAEAQDQWLGIREAMFYVPDDGVLDWEGLMRVAVKMEMNCRMRFFSSIPP